MYLNRGHEQIKNNLDDISNLNAYSYQDTTSSNDYISNNIPNTNVINQNFNIENIENKGKTIQERTKNTLFYQNSKENNNNLKNNSNYSNNTMVKNYSQNTLNNLQSITDRR